MILETLPEMNLVYFGFIFLLLSKQVSIGLGLLYETEEVEQSIYLALVDDHQ